MNALDGIDEARRLKARALAARDENDPEGAVRLLRRAEELLRAMIDQLREQRGDEPPGRQEADAAEQLAHILGSIGGTLRRTGDYAEAIGAYDAGRALERPGAGYGIVNSYTLVQGLVSRVFLEPGCVGPGADPVHGLRVHDALGAARAEVQHQLAGSRSQDEYAAADLALVLVLLGEDAWEEAVDDFLDLRPEPYAVDVTRELLDALRERVELADPMLAARLAAANERLAEPS